MPEVIVTGLAAWNGEHGMALGTVLGSNVANIGLVLGGTAYLLPTLFGKALTRRDGLWLVGSLGILYAVSLDHELTRWDGAILVLSFVVFQVLLVIVARGFDPADSLEEEAAHQVRRPGWRVVWGSLAIAGGAKLVMFGGEALAVRVGVPGEVIAFTVFALGTSLPELAAGVGSALRGHADIGVGNVVGSNVFNTLAAVGLAVWVRPTGPGQGNPGLERTFEALLTRDLPLVLAFSLALVVLLGLAQGRWRRAKSTLLLVGYFVYCGWILLESSSTLS